LNSVAAEMVEYWEVALEAGIRFMDRSDPSQHRLTHAELLQLKRWNTPTIYNGWEQITTRDIAHEGFNIEETRDFMPQMGPMIGYAVTVVIEPSCRTHKTSAPNAWHEYRDYVAAQPGPKIVVVQDLDKPQVLGSFWGEVNANIHQTLGCVGTIVDGAIRDVDEMTAAGFKAIARRLCVGHAFSTPVRWGVPVEVFGTRVEPGQLIHADKHGFLAIPAEDEVGLLEASRAMDTAECETLIAAARQSHLSMSEKLAAIRQASLRFAQIKASVQRQS
jgi:4-hydroxy-4-methyl-2-oxoglutarate aldolase